MPVNYWHGAAALAQRKKIENVLDEADKQENLELAAHLARYACVLVSGLLEVAISNILVQYTVQHGAPSLQRYIGNDLNRFQNPKVTKIVDLLNKFEVKWSEAFISSLDQQLRDSVNSVVDNRNQIAHGKDTGVTPVRVRNYFNDSLKLLELVADVVNGKIKASA